MGLAAPVVVVPGVLSRREIDRAMAIVDDLIAAAPPPAGHVGHHFYWPALAPGHPLLGLLLLGRIRGMVAALVRGRVWYLSMFFVLPGDQGRGLGQALLERALAYGEARGAEVRSVWSSLDPRAQARYVMAGMAPRWPIYRLEGDAAAVERLKGRVGLGPRERELPCDPGAAEKLTAEVFGDARADDLAHWRSDGSAAVAIKRSGELVAFAYRRGERVGPAAGRDETALLQAVAVAAAAGAGGGRSVRMRVPGACASLLEALVGCGFRIGDLAVFLASRPFDRPELYLPSGPILY